MIDINETRARISNLLDEIVAGSSALQARGVDPGHARDRREAEVIVKRVTERAYGGQA